MLRQEVAMQKEEAVQATIITIKHFLCVDTDRTSRKATAVPTCASANHITRQIASSHRLCIWSLSIIGRVQCLVPLRFVCSLVLENVMSRYTVIPSHCGRWEVTRHVSWFPSGPPVLCPEVLSTKPHKLCCMSCKMGTNKCILQVAEEHY